MADAKISDLTAKTSPARTDEVEILDNSNGSNKRATLDAIGNLLVGSGIQTVTKTLNNDQIIHLPTTPIEIIPAPGANKAVLPTLVVLRLKWVADYDTIDGGSFIFFCTPTTTDHIVSALAESGGNVSALLANGDKSWGILLPKRTTSGGTAGILDDDIVNQPYNLKLFNNGAGNLTEGNAGNELKVTAYYTVIDIS